MVPSSCGTAEGSGCSNTVATESESNTGLVHVTESHSPLQSLAASIVGTPSTARRPRSSVDVAQTIADLVSGILNLMAIDPAFAFTSYNAEDNLSSTLVSISSLLVGPCPEILRVQAGRAIVAVLDHLRAVAKVDAATLAVANSAAMAT